MVFIDSFQRNLSPKKLKWIDTRFLRVRIISALLRGPYRIHKFAQCGEGGSKIWKCCGRRKWNPALSSFSSHLSERRFLCSLTLRSTDRPTWTLKVIRRWMPRMPNDGTEVVMRWLLNFGEFESWLLWGPQGRSWSLGSWLLSRSQLLHGVDFFKGQIML